jgi:hypothetical protein
MIKLTESEKAAVFIAIINENERLNEKIESLDTKIENPRTSFESGMRSTCKRDSLNRRRKFLFSTIDKFKSED